MCKVKTCPQSRLSILGALIIFFSWVITNNLESRYSRTKQTLQTAEATFHLYGTLHELSDQIKFIATYVVMTKHETEDLMRRNGGIVGPTNDDRNSSDFSFANACSLAQLFEGLAGFCGAAMEYSQNATPASSTSREVNAIYQDVLSICLPMREMNFRAARLSGDVKVNSDAYRTAVENYAAFVSEKAMTSMPLLYERIVNASNRQLAEGRAEMQVAQTRADISGKTAKFLYIVGSIIVMGGQWLHKRKTKQLTPLVVTEKQTEASGKKFSENERAQPTAGN